MTILKRRCTFSFKKDKYFKFANIFEDEEVYYYLEEILKKNKCIIYLFKLKVTFNKENECFCKKTLCYDMRILKVGTWNGPHSYTDLLSKNTVSIFPINSTVGIHIWKENFVISLKSLKWREFVSYTYVLNRTLCLLLCKAWPTFGKSKIYQLDFLIILSDGQDRKMYDLITAASVLLFLFGYIFVECLFQVYMPFDQVWNWTEFIIRSGN